MPARCSVVIGRDACCSVTSRCAVAIPPHEMQRRSGLPAIAQILRSRPQIFRLPRAPLQQRRVSIKALAHFACESVAGNMKANRAAPTVRRIPRRRVRVRSRKVCSAAWCDDGMAAWRAQNIQGDPAKYTCPIVACLRTQRVQGGEATSIRQRRRRPLPSPFAPASFEAAIRCGGSTKFRSKLQRMDVTQELPMIVVVDRACIGLAEDCSNVICVLDRLLAKQTWRRQPMLELGCARGDAGAVDRCTEVFKEKS